MNIKYDELRSRHKTFIYHDFSVNGGEISFHFSIDDFHFKPQWRFNVPLQGDISLLAFNLGMAELVSYWKCACPPVVEVRCGALDAWQIAWWKKLYRNGLGEFFYLNNIEPDEDFMQIYATGAQLPPPEQRELTGNLIPVGGGKDSVVTLELLRDSREFNSCYIVGNIQSALDCANVAGYSDSQIIQVSRTIDPVLLELNKQGYLNGHTPFSSIIAFSSLVFAYIIGKKYIVLSNESSANEGNTADGVNHQYSKSIEFERDFREYVSRIGADLPEYFSLLRPLTEARITEIFFHLPQYYNVFKSCNVGSKTNTWCCKCAKCLYVYVMLAAWLDDESLVNHIFGKNLLEDEELAPLLEALANPTYDKPFECVGTRDEVNFSLWRAIGRITREKNMPKLLRDFSDKIVAPDWIEFDVLNHVDENNFVPKGFMKLLPLPISPEEYLKKRKEEILRMKEIHDFFRGKKILILGFGLEGRSTLNIIQNLPCEIIIADKNPEAVKWLTHHTLYTGENYLDSLYNSEIDIIMKSPGISFKGLEIPDSVKAKITSQTDLLMRFSKNKIVGITGTKGKSTVSSLIHHVLNYCGASAELIGNIGVPPLAKQFAPETILVCEMSCHQLEYVQDSPDVAVFLNLYEEHLDHYNSFADYRAAKENIFLYQKSGDLLIYLDELESQKLLSSKSEKLALPYECTITYESYLPGKHNQYNIMVALKVCKRLGCDEKQAISAIKSFTGLPHRLEFVGEIDGVKYVNDSISTIPRAAILAIETYPDTDTLIIGGMDRGICYNELIDFIDKSKNCGIINMIALPDSGYKIADALKNGKTNIYRAKNMEDAVQYAVQVTKRRCILSPAAASYNVYKNFEERGNHFKQLVEARIVRP
jgi:UDP-N-acetylmuramoylalanine--D-glutamate ligase